MLLIRLLAAREELKSTIFEQLEMLEVVLTNGQGILIWLFFRGSMSADRLRVQLVLKLRRYWYGNTKLILPSPDELDEATIRVCRHFRRHHLERCLADMADMVASRFVSSVRVLSFFRRRLSGGEFIYGC